MIYYTHFTNEKTGAQIVNMTLPASHSKNKAEWGPDLGLPTSQASAFSTRQIITIIIIISKRKW